MKSTLLLLTLTLFTYFTQAQYTLTDEDVYIEDGVITSCYVRNAGDATHLIIPDTLEQQEIIGIGPGTFYMDEQWEKVTFPESLLFIQSSVFNSATLNELILPPNIRFVGDFAFNQLSIKEITIPKGVNYIGGSAFQSCGIESTIFEEPSSIRLIGGGAFHNNYYLDIVLPENIDPKFSEYYDSNGKNYQPYDVIEEDDFWTNAYYSRIPERVMGANDLILKDDTIIFGDYFKHTIIPDSINGKVITTIGKQAFYGHSIDSLTLPYGIQNVLEEAFHYNDFQHLTIPKTVTFIGEGAFSHCNISNIFIPKNITKILDRTFYRSYSKSITLPVGLETIGKLAFGSNFCSDINIPQTVSFIDKEAFDIINKDYYLDKGYDLYDKIDLPHPVIKEGYEFTHWENENGTTIAAIEDFETSYSAQFVETAFFQVSGTVLIDEPDATFIDLSGDFNGVAPVNSDSIFSFRLNAGRNMTITPNKEGYVFQPENYVINDIQADISDIYFSASRLDYQINFLAAGNGTIKGESYQNIIHGHKTTAIEAIPSTDYKFNGWYFDEDSLYTNMNPLTITVTQDYNLTAKFSLAVGVYNTEKTTTIAYPNPVQDNLTIQAEYPIQRVKVYNSLGVCIINKSINNLNIFEIQDLSQHIQGMAFIQILGISQQELIKVIVE